MFSATIYQGVEVALLLQLAAAIGATGPGPHSPEGSRAHHHRHTVTTLALPSLATDWPSLATAWPSLALPSLATDCVLCCCAETLPPSLWLKNCYLSGAKMASSWPCGSSSPRHAPAQTTKLPVQGIKPPILVFVQSKERARQLFHELGPPLLFAVSH
jgi:hypothetical protein